MAALDFWYEFGSTYSYPAAMRIERLADAARVEVRWRPFLLGPIFKTYGWNDSPFNVSVAKGRYMWRDLTRICEAEGLPLKLPPMQFPQNGLKAARLALVGGREGWTPAFSAIDGCRTGVDMPTDHVERLALGRSLTLADLSWPQAAMMSRPRGLRTGLA
jgi:hypothetical protein